MPRVTICVPVCNGASLIRACPEGLAIIGTNATVLPAVIVGAALRSLPTR